MNFNKTFSLLALIIFFTFPEINIANSNPIENAKKFNFTEHGPFYGIKKNNKKIRGVLIGQKTNTGSSDWYGTFDNQGAYWKGYYKHTYADGKILY